MMQLARRGYYAAPILGMLLGTFVALVAVPTLPTWDDVFWRVHDEWRPVATIDSTAIAGPVGETRMRLTVQRHRGECAFVGPAAFEVLPDGSAVRVFAARVDAQPAVNLSDGMRLMAEWRFWPTGIGRLRVWMDYVCDGRAVRVEVRGLA